MHLGHAFGHSEDHIPMLRHSFLMPTFSHWRIYDVAFLKNTWKNEFRSIGCTRSVIWPCHFCPANITLFLKTLKCWLYSVNSYVTVLQDFKHSSRLCWWCKFLKCSNLLFVTVVFVQMTLSRQRIAKLTTWFGFLLWHVQVLSQEVNWNSPEFTTMWQVVRN